MSNDDAATRKMEPATIPSRIQRGPPAGSPPLRLSMSATVVKGFGRGSKLLGIPTANMDMKEIGQKVNGTPTGIYLGYTMLEGVVYKAVVSIGWNPYFENSEKTVEPHLLHKFDEDFYGEKLHLLLCGFIRNELNFKSLDDLITAIGDDIRYAKRKFEEPEVAALAVDDPFWADLAAGGSTPGDGDNDEVNSDDRDNDDVNPGPHKNNCSDSNSNSDGDGTSASTSRNNATNNDGNTVELAPTTGDTDSTCILNGSVSTGDTTSSNKSSTGNTGSTDNSSSSGNNQAG